MINMSDLSLKWPSVHSLSNEFTILVLLLINEWVKVLRKSLAALIRPGKKIDILELCRFRIAKEDQLHEDLEPKWVTEV